MPGRNATSYTAEKRFFVEIADIKRQIRAQTTPQNIGADVLQTVAVPDFSLPPILAGPVSLVANSYLNVSIVITPTTTKVAQATPLFGFYIDAYDDPHHFPDGSALTPGQKNVRASIWEDLKGFDINSGVHNFTVIIDNYDTAAHNIYIATRFLAPKGSLS